MGRVYLAEHVRMGRKSAVTVLSPELNFSAEAISRFHREAANASRINHPNVAAIYDFGETTEGTLYLAMEFVEGETLRALLAREPRLDVMRAAKLIKQAAEALAAAHHLGIVHRDLKPDNIMVARHMDGTDLVKVVDFGIAKTIDERNGSQTLTTAGVSIGTPEYMSPEQLAGEKLDARTDVYSLALVLFHLLTGTLPYPRLTSRETLVRRLTSSPRRLRDVAPDIDWPVQLQRALDRALAPYVEDRYSSVGDFGRDVLAAAMSMHQGRAAALTPASDAHTIDEASSATSDVKGRHPLVAIMIVFFLAGAALLVRAEPIGREPTHRLARDTSLLVTADSGAAPSSTTQHADTAAVSTAVEPKPVESQPGLTTDTTVQQAGATKPAEHDSSSRAANDSVKFVIRDSVKPSVHDSAKTASHESAKPAVHDSTRTTSHESAKPAVHDSAKTASHDSVKTVSRDSQKPVARDSLKPIVRDSTKAAKRDSTKAVKRDSTKAAKRDSTKAAQRDSGAAIPGDSTPAVADDVRATPGQTHPRASRRPRPTGTSSHP